MAGRTIHVSLDLRGALMHWKDRRWRRAVRNEAGGFLSPLEVKAAFLDHLARGVKLIPFGEPCEGFDPVTGCPGHEVPEVESEATVG